MKTHIFITSICITLISAGGAWAGEDHDHAADKGSMMTAEQEMMPKEAEGSESAVEVGNTICPVSGEKVGEMGDIVKVEYNGKIYNLCCSMCAKDFKKDPEKYSKIAEKEMKAKNEGQMPDAEGMEHDHSGHDHQE